MELLSEITIHRDKDDALIQLFHGNLTAIPAEYAVDILVISAFPRDYLPVHGTLMGALYEKGIKVGEMARNKDIDLISQLGCWLSMPMDEEQQKRFNFKRILCFEPGGAALQHETIVGNIFRCINTFAFNKDINNLAMPIVASGNQRIPLDKMLPAILETAFFWMERGLPLASIKLVLYSADEVREALPIFTRIREKYESSKSVTKEPEIIPSVVYADEGVKNAGSSNKEHAIAGGGAYDYFISYAHTHTDLINSFVQQMKRWDKNLRIFYDKDSIPPGGLWIKQISDTIQEARKVLVFLSPDYDQSMACWDEFQCAKLMEYNRKTSLIQTIYLYNYPNTMPPIMGIYSYLDCRNGDFEKLAACIPKLLQL